MVRFPALSQCALAFLALFSFSGSGLAAQSDAHPSQAPVPPPAQNTGPAQTNPVAQPAAPPTTSPASQAPTLTIRETVRRVIVDVMVRDANGKPVHGLTASDFSITEDKQPQRVLSFDTYDFDKPSISRGPNAPPLPPDVFLNVPTVPERGPLYVMLLDLVNTQVDNQMWARQQILKFISNKPAGTRFAIFVNSDMLRLVQGFTDDKDLLYATLDPNHPKPDVPRVFLLGLNYGYGDPYAAADMLTHIGQYLDGIPGRKNLIWASDIFPLAIGAQADDPAYWDIDVKTELNELAQAQVAIFPLDVAGVGVQPAALIRYAREDIISSATGGRSFFSTNDVTGALEEATEDGGNYYTLTYAPPSRMEDDKCHNHLGETP